MFEFNEKNFLIKGRRGDSAKFILNFSSPVDEYCIHFFIKKNIGDKDSIIEKKIINPTTKAVAIELTSKDTEKLECPNFGFELYFWGVKIHKGDNFTQTIIPEKFKNLPQMHIYPSIGEV